MSTKIEWTDETWNPITGCTPVSAGCKNCYARRMAQRLKGRFGYPDDEPFKVTLHPDKLEEPLHWQKPRRVFVCSMGDLFHKDVPDEFRHRMFNRIADTQRHTYLILTKRPERMRDFCEHYNRWRLEPFPNVWLGVSVEDQKTADERIPLLMQTPAAVRFISAEPLLGPIELNDVPAVPLVEDIDECTWRLGQVICGAETGSGARPMDLDWARQLRDDCAEASVPFFFKRDSDGNRKLDGKMHEEYPA